jgi:hypothetical protein
MNERILKIRVENIKYDVISMIINVNNGSYNIECYQRIL